MVNEEVEVFERLRIEFDNGYIQKNTANKAKAIYNKYHEKSEYLTYCMCIATKRMIHAKDMLEWYEKQS